MSAEPIDLLRAEVRRLRRQLLRREAKALIVTDTGPGPTDTSRTLSRAELRKPGSQRQTSTAVRQTVVLNQVATRSSTLRYKMVDTALLQGSTTTTS